jgi:hypothetical protein
MDKFGIERSFNYFLYSSSQKELFEVIMIDESITTYIELAKDFIEFVRSADILVCKIFQERIDCDDLIVTAHQFKAFICIETFFFHLRNHLGDRLLS